ncbi:MAG: 30S ribosomal protein S4 [Alphaproteobacteria bacterium]
MTKRIRSKSKIERRLGENLWGRPKSPYNKRPHPPGQHWQRRRKQTDFGLQLQGKQKLKGYYGNISERRFRRYYQEAARMRGDTGECLIELLERRLDTIVYRAKLASTVFAARQLINHGHILVDGKRVKIPSLSVKDGSTVNVRNKSRGLAIVLEATALPERDAPAYIEVDHKEMSAKFIHAPKLSDVPYPVRMEPNLVIEYYSR